ncbi:MAG TPA: YebC/PmpR family DNA-binding transcriptional regulator [Actinomycetota bacterium]|nr:YebC/PmpR family DNA-binding transcriptional regulator [Actinomycetota bacterium]
MGGHSHWKGIKEKKGKLDKARGKLFAKLLRAIEISARQGDPNPDNNPNLFDAIQRAKDASVPKDNIDRAVARGAGEIAGENYETIFYEGYASGGVAMLVEGLTNNRNRTSQDLRAIFSKHGGSLGEPGSVKWMFDKRGVIVVAKSAADEDKLMELALEAGADDVRDAGGDWEIVCEQKAFEAVRGAIDAAGIERLSAEVTMLPQNTVAVDGENARKVLRMMDALEDHDDVQAVYANFDIPESVFAEL